MRESRTRVAGVRIRSPGRLEEHDIVRATGNLCARGLPLIYACVERTMGFEPTLRGWKSPVLPLPLRSRFALAGSLGIEPSSYGLTDRRIASLLGAP